MSTSAGAMYHTACGPAPAWKTTQRYVGAQRTRAKCRRCFTVLSQHDASPRLVNLPGRSEEGPGGARPHLGALLPSVHPAGVEKSWMKWGGFLADRNDFDQPETLLFFFCDTPGGRPLCLRERASDGERSSSGDRFQRFVEIAKMWIFFEKAPEGTEPEPSTISPGIRSITAVHIPELTCCYPKKITCFSPHPPSAQSRSGVSLPSHRSPDTRHRW